MAGRTSGRRGAGKAAGKKKVTGPTLDDLVALAEDMNLVMGLEPPIELLDDVEDQKIAIVNEAMDENDVVQVYTSDEISAASIKTLKALGVVPVEPPEEEAGGGDDAGGDDAGGDEPGELPTDEEIEAMDRKELVELIDGDDSINLNHKLAKLKTVGALRKALIAELTAMEEAGGGDDTGGDEPPELPTDEEVEAMEKPALLELIEELELDPAIGKARAVKTIRAGVCKALEELENAQNEAADDKKGGADDKKADTKKKGSAAPSNKKKAPPKLRYTRASAFASALAGVEDFPIPLEELAELGDAEYMKEADKPSNIKEATWIQTHGLNILIGLELGEITAEGFTYFK